jgi:hypothetical protein
MLMYCLIFQICHYNSGKTVSYGAIAQQQGETGLFRTRKHKGTAEEETAGDLTELCGFDAVCSPPPKAAADFEGGALTSAEAIFVSALDGAGSFSLHSVSYLKMKTGG